ncbi:MAG: ROK family protein [Candidatus Melainabacteria bacterium]|nr:MAG: ROK family protein [Candidatus Melainabacteria bacterium]
MGYEYTINNIKQAIHDLMKETNTSKDNIEGIGFGFPGQIDFTNGIVRALPNIPGWVNVPLSKIMEDEFKIPTRVDNDVRVAALGELNFGAGVGCQNLVCITVGTGIGSGLIINGKLVRGASNAAGEIGHIKMQMFDDPICGCGDQGCFEAFASGLLLSLWLMIISKAANLQNLENLLQVEKLHLISLQKLQKAGDCVALKIFEIIGEYIGIGLSSVINLLNPEKIVIGGGVADAGDILFDPIRKTIEKRAMKIQADACQIVKAKLGNTAGVIGASLLIKS